MDWDELAKLDSLVTPGMPMVSRWPARYESWDGHLVIFADSLSPHVAELTLLSLADWDKILSANGSDRPTEAADTAAAYTEFGLNNWAIPTETQARKMKSELDVDVINDKLTQLFGDEIHVKDGSENARYLCEEAQKSFSMAQNTNITQAGAKTKYRLRLVKLQRVGKM